MHTSYNNTESNKIFCEAYGCLLYAKGKICVSVGRLGNIELDLCDECIKKFRSKMKQSVL
jgi:hypothetical protein